MTTEVDGNNVVSAEVNADKETKADTVPEKPDGVPETLDVAPEKPKEKEKTSEERRKERRGRAAREVAFQLTQPLDGDHNTAFIGVHPKEQVSAPPLPAHVRGRRQIIMFTLKQLPGHYAWQTWYEIVPCMAAGIYTALFCVYIRTVLTGIPLAEGSIASFALNAAVLSPGWRSAWTGLLGLVFCSLWSFSQVFLLYMIAWNWRLIWRQLAWAYFWAGVIFGVGYATSVLYFRWLGHPYKVGNGVCTALHWTLWGVCAAHACLPYVYKAGQKIGNTNFVFLQTVVQSGAMWQLVLYCFGTYLVLSIDSDIPKVFVVLVLHPFLTEIMSVLTRFACRCMRHNHPCSSFQLMAFTVCWKKIFTRFFVASMSTAWLVLVITTFNAFLEIFMRYTMPIRDRWIYRTLFKEFLPLDKNPNALMSDARNRGLRAETENLEALSDMVYILVMFLWPLFLGASFNGETRVMVGGFSPDAFWFKQFSQYAIENFIDLCIVLFMAIGQNYHVTMQSKVKCPWWSWIVAGQAMCSLGTFFFYVLPWSVCTWTDTEGVQPHLLDLDFKFSYCTKVGVNVL